MTIDKMNEVLKSESEDSLLLQAVLLLINTVAEDELDTALRASQTDGERAFNNGRAAAFRDLVFLINEKRK